MEFGKRGSVENRRGQVFLLNHNRITPLLDPCVKHPKCSRFSLEGILCDKKRSIR